MCRPRSSNAAEAAANKASDLSSPARPVGRPEQREQHQDQLSKAYRRNSKNAVASQRDDQVTNQIGVDRNKFRRRNASENLSVNDSGRRRPWVELNVSSVAELRQKFGNRSRNRVVADLQVKQAAKEKEYRAPMVSRRSSSSSASNNTSSGNSNKSNGGSSSNSNEAARLAQASADRRKGSRKADIKDNPDKRRLPGSNNFGAITPAAPECEHANHNRIGAFLCDGLNFRPHLLLNVFRPAYSLGDVT